MHAGTGIPPGESLKHRHTHTHAAHTSLSKSMAQAIIPAILLYKSQ